MNVSQIINQDKARYKEVILGFVEKWRNKIANKDILTNALDIYEWVATFDAEMAKKSTSLAKLTHLKRGISLLKIFVDKTTELKNYYEDTILLCRQDLLKNGGKCTQQQLAQLNMVRNGLDEFIVDVIGCGNLGVDLLFAAINKYRNMAGADLEFIKKLDQLELVCYQHRLDLIKK